MALFGKKLIVPPDALLTEEEMEDEISSHFNSSIVRNAYLAANSAIKQLGNYADVYDNIGAKNVSLVRDLHKFLRKFYDQMHEITENYTKFSGITSIKDDLAPCVVVKLLYPVSVITNNRDLLFSTEGYISEDVYKLCMNLFKTYGVDDPDPYCKFATITLENTMRYLYHYMGSTDTPVWRVYADIIQEKMETLYTEDMTLSSMVTIAHHTLELDAFHADFILRVMDIVNECVGNISNSTNDSTYKDGTL